MVIIVVLVNTVIIVVLVNTVIISASVSGGTTVY